MEIMKYMKKVKESGGIGRAIQKEGIYKNIQIIFFSSRIGNSLVYVQHKLESFLHSLRESILKIIYAESVRYVETSGLTQWKENFTIFQEENFHTLFSE